MRKIGNPTILRAAEAETGADTEVVKERVAIHALLAADGSEVDDFEKATGIKYTLKATSKAFQYQVPNAKAGTPETMLAIFGARTLATNEASQVRQKDPDGDQIGAIEERFLLIEGGTWVDRSGGVGAKVDLDILADAIVAVGAAKGQTKDKAAVRAKLEDKALVSAIRKNPEFSAEYSRLMGRTIKSVDDLLAGV